MPYLFLGRSAVGESAYRSGEDHSPIGTYQPSLQGVLARFPSSYPDNIG